MAREYDSYFKKAVKAGNLNFDSKYPEIIKIFTEARDDVLAKGWNEEAVIYSSHIKKYTELFEKENKVRELESNKDEEKRVYEEFQKVQRDGFDAEKLKHVEAQKMKEYDEKKFQEEINDLVDKAEKIARDYDLALKRALKEGKIIEDSPFNKIIEIYSRIKDSFISKGWKDQVLIYTNQIKIYEDKWEKDKKLRELESKKVLKQKEFENAQKAPKMEDTVGKDVEKLKRLEELAKQEGEEDVFTREIDDIVDKAEKTAREYELAIKKGSFEKKCPYLEIAEIYKDIRKKVYVRRWKDEAAIYGNQIKHYQEKFEKDKHLRELEADKIKKQMAFKESLKTTKEDKPLRLQELEALSSKSSETEEISKQAMDLIDEAEKAVRSYELSLKKDILTYKSPYEQVILNYERASKLFQKIGWKEDAYKLMETVNFYRDKKVKDDNLRALEQQKIAKQEEQVKERKIEAKLAKEAEEELLRLKIQALEVKKKCYGIRI